jgi:hypothetical protein
MKNISHFQKKSVKIFGNIDQIAYLYYMRLRDTQLILLMITLLITHNPCRMRVSPIEAEPAPRTEYLNK